MHVDLLVSGGTVVTVDPDRRVLPGGAVAIDGNRIAAVLPAGSPLPTARETIDASGHIVMPGLVDGHGHAGHCLTRGLGDGTDGDTWMAMMEAIYDHASDEHFWRAESRIAALERLKFGVTTSLSMTGSAPRIDSIDAAVHAASGYIELGLRHVVAAGPPSAGWPKRYTARWSHTAVSREVTLDHAVQTTEEIIQALDRTHDGRIRAFVGPSAVVDNSNDEHLTSATGKRLANIVARYNTGFHAHAYRGMIYMADRLCPDLLAPGTSLAHCAGIDAGEIQIMARRGVSASHGPLTHAFAEARFPVIEALEAGVNVAISTDGTAPDRPFDLLAQARIAAQLQRAHFADTTLLPAGRLLRMITIDAARGLGLESEIGSLEPGKRADLILVDTCQSHLAPDVAPVLRLIHAASGSDVTTAIVDGRVLMRDRVVAGINEQQFVENASSALADTLERAGLGDPNRSHPDLWDAIRYDPARAIRP